MQDIFVTVRMQIIYTPKNELLLNSYIISETVDVPHWLHFMQSKK